MVEYRNRVCLNIVVISIYHHFRQWPCLLNSIGEESLDRYMYHQFLIQLTSESWVGVWKLLTLEVQNGVQSHISCVRLVVRSKLS
jgi:hypothetical protein